MSTMNSNTVVLSLARTPFGKLGGALASLDATTLGSVALIGALQRAGIDPTEIEHIIFWRGASGRRRAESGASGAL